MSILEELKKKIADIETQSLAMDGCRPTFTVSEIMDLIDSVELAQNSPNACTDTIYRQAAIDALAKMMPRSYTPDGSHPADEEIFKAQEIFADCIEALEILPSAQPERKKGRWIDEGFYADGHGAHAFRCSECGGHIIEYDADPFCRWCGADMRGEQDDS